MQKSMYPPDAGNDLDFDFWKSSNERAVQRVDEYMEERMFCSASPEMVRYVSVARYATLIEMARASLRGMFSAEDFRLLLNAHPQPWWPESSWCYCDTSVADALSAYMSDDQADPCIVALYNKISELDTVRLLALTDLLECGWRRGIDWIIESTELHRLN